MVTQHPHDGTKRPAASVGRFEGWYGASYNRMMRRTWSRKLIYTALGGAPTMRDLSQLVDRIIAEHPSGGTLLDVPCGEGVVERELAERAWNGRAVALDLARRAVRRTSAIVVDYDLDVVRGSALDMPFADRSMATIVSINGLHVMPDHQLFMRELARVVSPTGSIWITTLVSGRGLRRRTMIAAAGRFGVLPIAPPTHAELLAVIDDAGLRVAEDFGGSTVAALRLQLVACTPPIRR